MKEALDNAKDELKRVDHLFYVSLKYTRTADMMKHMVDRLISTFSYGISSLLKYSKEHKKLSEIPNNPVMSAKKLLELYPDDEMREHMDLYLRLRKISRAEYTKREEFRRHVTMTCIIDNNDIVEINIDILKENYESAKKFIRYVDRLVEKREED